MSNSNDKVEVAIIGSGPGGIAAAANAAKRNLSHVLIEKSELANTIHSYQLRKLVMAEPQKLPLRSHVSFAEGSREEILENFQKGMDDCGVNFIRGEVKSIEKTESGFLINCSSTTVTATNVVLAIGTMGIPRKLGVEGEDKAHVHYRLADPDAIVGKNVVVVGAGDAAIENALALAENNNVSLQNRTDEFPRAKDANRKKILAAIEGGSITHLENSEVLRIEDNAIVLSTPNGDASVECNHLIIRAGGIPPRKFVESCGIEFPSNEIDAVPVVSDRYESNVPGIYIVGSLIGYPLIKQAMNQGHEVIEHILGNEVEPADSVLIEEVLAPMEGDAKTNLELINKTLSLFSTLSKPQFRELVIDSKVHVLSKGETVFAKNDYTDTFWCMVSGSADVLTDNNQVIHSFKPGDFFGELGLISGRRRTATVSCAEDKSVFLETKRNQILKLMGSVPEFKKSIDNVFLVRILKASIFPSVDFASLSELAQKSEIQNFKKGDVVFSEGDEGDALYIILKGSVKISRRNDAGVDVAQTYLPVGNYVGEMALLNAEPRSATVSAAVACKMAVIKRDVFLKFLEDNQSVKEKVRQIVKHRQIENITSSQSEHKGAALDFVLKQGISDAENVLLIDSDLCIACDNCEKACAATHGGYSRLDRKAGESFASIQVPISCRHCENPLCMTDCPPDALTRMPNGEVLIRETCIGCGNCMNNCPYGVIQMVYEKPPKKSWLSWFGFGDDSEESKGSAKAAKCDMCSSLDGGPACVRSCPTGAAMRANPSEMMRMLADRKESH